MGRRDLRTLRNPEGVVWSAEPTLEGTVRLTISIPGERDVVRERRFPSVQARDAEPWLSTDAMKERTKFVLEWERGSADAPDGKVNISELTRKYGINRQTGYEWLGRYQDSGSLDALADRSSRPLTSPTKIPEDIEVLVVAAKKTYPKWGPRKLRALLVERDPQREWPGSSCMNEILKRHGLTRPRRIGQQSCASGAAGA